MQISFGETMLDLDLRKAPLYLSNVNYRMLLQIGSSIRSPSMRKPFSASAVGLPAASHRWVAALSLGSVPCVASQGCGLTAEGEFTRRKASH